MRTKILVFGLFGLVTASSGCGSDPASDNGTTAGAGGAATGGAGGAGAAAGSGSTGGGGAAGSAGGAAGAGGAVAPCPEGHPLGSFYGKPTVQVMVGSSGPYTFVYDTGAPESGLDTAVKQAVGDGPYAIAVGGKTVELPWIYVTDIQQWLGAPGVDGVLGADVMGKFAVTLDVERKRFWLDDTRDEAALLGCTHAEADPVEVKYEQDGYFFVPGAAEGLAGWFLVDTGASLGAMPNGVFDQLQAAHPRPALEGFYTPAAVGTFWARLTAVGYLEVGGRRVDHIVTRTLDDGLIPTPPLDGKPFLGVLPTDYLSRFLFTIDHPAGVIRLDGYQDVPKTVASRLHVVGIGLEQTTEPPVHVAQVLGGSSAESAGVQVGDAIVSVDGASFAALTPYQRPWSLVGDAGDTFQVELERDGQALWVELTAQDLLVDPEL